MKKILLFIILLFVAPTVTMADSFSDLDAKCTWSADGIHDSTINDKLILKHINGRITKTE